MDEQVVKKQNLWNKITNVVAILIVISVVIWFFSYITEFINGNYEKNFDITPYIHFITENQDEFDSMAIQSHSWGVNGFCIEGKNDYKINGVYMDFGQNKFVEMAPLGAHNWTKEQALDRAKILLEQIDTYKNFLIKYPFIKCIEEDLNLTMGKEYSYLFKINDYKGFAYSSDGSVNNNVSENYAERTYKEIKKIDNTNWFEFTYINRFGINP